MQLEVDPVLNEFSLFIKAMELHAPDKLAMLVLTAE
jgi:hypothetical protein